MILLFRVFSIIVCFTSVFSGYCFSRGYDYDLVIAGGGSAGLASAKIAASLPDIRIALINDGGIGGSAIWYADLPTKILIQLCNEIYENSRQHYSGIVQASNIKINLDAILPLVRERCKQASGIYSHNFFSQRNIDFYVGRASFKNMHTLWVGDRAITANKIIIATGSLPVQPNVKGIDKVPYLTPDNFFKANTLPSSLVIIGGGPLGIEMASCLNRLGIKVTLIMKYGLILPTYDFELVQELTQTLKDEGVSIQCSTYAQSVEQRNGQVVVHCKNRFGESCMFSAESLFVATGRKPNIASLDLDKVDIECIGGGIKTNNRMQSSLPNVYACGDVVRGPLLFGRVAYYQAYIATVNALGVDRIERADGYNDIPKIIYTARPLAGLGITEQEARKFYGNTIRIATFDYGVLARAHIDGTTDGKVKFICKEDGTLLGIHIYGERAGEIIDSMALGQRIENIYNEYSFKMQTVPNYNSLFWEALSVMQGNVHEKSVIS